MPAFIIIPLPISFTELLMLLIIALVVLVIHIIRKAAKGNSNNRQIPPK